MSGYYRFMNYCQQLRKCNHLHKPTYAQNKIMLYMNFNPPTRFSDELLFSQRRQYTGNIKYYYINHICGIDELILSYVGVYE